MINPQLYNSKYSPSPYISPASNREISSKGVKQGIRLELEWKNLNEGDAQEDLLAFMESFNFPDLEELKSSLSKSGKYKKLEVEEIIAGLKTLPEYRD